MLELTTLNKEQLEAVNKVNGNYMVIAGAGTGKTRVLTYRIARLISLGIKEDGICAFSFTTKATREMKFRIQKLLGRETNITIQTFHSFAYSYLNMLPHLIAFKQNFTIIDEADKDKILTSILKEYNLSLQLQEVKQAISSIKNHNNHSYLKIKEILELNILYNFYQKTLKELNKLDLDDLLLYFYQLLKTNNPIIEDLIKQTKHILVDEFQDTNKIQYEIVIMLSSINKNLYCVGDEDQSIYSFRGSNETNIQDFLKNQKAQVLKLEQNYRSSKQILETANKCISNNIARTSKILYTNRENNNFKVQKHFFETIDVELNYLIKEIENLLTKGYQYSDIAILYRNNNLSVDYERILIKNKIPFQLTNDKQFFKYKEIKTIISYLRFIINQNDNLALEEIINTPDRSIDSLILSQILLQAKTKNISHYESLKLLSPSKQHLTNFITLITNLIDEYLTKNPYDFLIHLITELNYLSYLSQDKDGQNKINRLQTFISLFKELEENTNLNDFLNTLSLSLNIKNPTNAITLQTIHQAKGLEYKVVFLVAVSEKILPINSNLISTKEEERRLFYVGITRAMDYLYLLHTKTRLINGFKTNLLPSNFIKEIL